MKITKKQLQEMVRKEARKALKEQRFKKNVTPGSGWHHILDYFGYTDSIRFLTKKMSKDELADVLDELDQDEVLEAIESVVSESDIENWGEKVAKKSRKAFDKFG